MGQQNSLGRAFGKDYQSVRTGRDAILMGLTRMKQAVLGLNEAHRRTMFSIWRTAS